MASKPAKTKIAKDDAVRYARERLIDGAAPVLIEHELRDQGEPGRYVAAWVQAAQAILHRALDADDIHAIRCAYLAAAAERVSVARRRVSAMQGEINTMSELLDEVDQSEGEAVEIAEARSSLSARIASKERLMLSYMNLAHRSQRDFLVAMVPKEARQAESAPEDDDIDEALQDVFG